MITETNQDGSVAPEATTGGEAATTDTITLSRAEYDELSSSVGSLKRELKDLRKASKELKEDSTPTLDSGLVEKTFLRAAGITKEDEVSLALETAKKWGMPLDKLVDDEDFQAKLGKLRIQSANLAATSGIKGDKSSGSAKDTTAYWMAQGRPPSRDDVSDDSTRRKIVREMLAQSKSKPKFYNQ